eukprot:9487564-Pyramimonas_sp.AAC.1
MAGKSSSGLCLVQVPAFPQADTPAHRWALEARRRPGRWPRDRPPEEAAQSLRGLGLVEGVGDVNAADADGLVAVGRDLRER